MENMITVTEKSPKFKKRTSKKWRLAGKITIWIIRIAVAIVLLFPYFYMILRSLMTVEEIESANQSLFPAVPQFINYVTIFKTGGYGKGILTTFSIIAINIVAVPFSASLIAYSFTKLQWKGRSMMFALMLGTMMLPSAVTQLPLYIIFSPKYLNWLNTILPLTIPNFFGGGAVYIFLLVQFMRGIPNEIENAAKIDGANTFLRYLLIIVPLCKTIIIFIMVQVFIAYWGDYYGPLVYLSSDKAPKTLALVLYNFITDNSAGTKTNILMAGAVFMSVIPTILFAFFQKQLIEGIVMSGLKG